MRNRITIFFLIASALFLYSSVTLCATTENDTEYVGWEYLQGLVWKKQQEKKEPKKQKLCENTNSYFDLAVTSGYVRKNDDLFEEVYGHGIFDIVTVDGCYYPCTNWGLGAKIGFWERHGKTTCFQECTRLREFPLIGYVRARIGHTLQLYASLGAGVIFAREKSYLGRAKKHSGIAEAELGLMYHFDNVFITGAVDALFPKQPHCKREATMFGGYGIRGGIGISF